MPEHSTKQTKFWFFYTVAIVLVFSSAFLPFFVFLLVISCVMGAIPYIFIRQAILETQRAVEIKSARDQIEQATAAAAFLGNLIDSADIPILATDTHGHITHTNPQAQQLLGIGAGLIGRPFDEVMLQPALHVLESSARIGEPGHARLKLVILGEMRTFDVAADPISGAQGAVLTFRDITELSRAMTLKADFVANASHELRTPIASIKGAIETLSGPAKDDERMSARLIEMIASNANRLELLAGDLLDLSRLESEDQLPNIVLVSISEVIDRALADLGPLAGQRSLILEPTVEAGLDMILTDRSMLVLMLRNLVGNAIKFAHEGTTVRILVSRASVQLDRTAPLPSGLDRTMGIELKVIDRGIGIPLAQQQRVFERFYQVEEARTGSGAKRGTGLGLAIVKHAAKRLGGSVQLQSVHQEGTTITIKLPCCADDRHDEG
ncbi:MAG: PAS domain S-box protein [Phycisphaerales bacterium]|nr:PAS domain S-box protein [Phycisphaerales bacterium]